MNRIAGKYDFISELGSGLTGTVYLVRHADLKVQYALKVLSNIAPADSAVIERFKQEAEILLKFTHPCIVQLRDFGRTEDGFYYMALEYCDGTLLSDLLRKARQFSVENALRMVEQVLDVLEAARKLGIVHRDIKPDNIMVLPGEGPIPRIKVLDFGIASLREGLGNKAHGQAAGSIVVGTPEYMAPEQISGDKELDHRVDIYATGILLYELLSGKVPFSDDNVARMLLMQLIQPLNPIDPQLSIPFIVEALAAKALHKNREDRYQSPAEFQNACMEARKTLSGEGTEKKIAVEQKEAASSFKSVSKKIPNQPGSKQATRILCLDDDPMVLNILEYLLRGDGFDVFTASSFSKIHEYIFDNKVDLLISDVNMPGLSGGKVCSIIKESVKDLKVILLSNIPERELEKLAAECKADGWMSKNTKPGEWVKQIKSMLP